MKNEQEGYIVEYTHIGNSVKVTAFDPSSLTEASVIAPANATKEQMTQLAVRKLQYLLGKESS